MPFTFTPEYLVEAPEPAVIGDPYVIVRSHRAYADADTPLVAWIRTETGKLDMEGAALSVVVEAAGSSLVTMNAESPEVGKLTFTVPAETIRNKFPRRGPYVLKAFADGRVIYTALLEVV